jgi:hypothetical protein
MHNLPVALRTHVGTNCCTRIRFFGGVFMIFYWAKSDEIGENAFRYMYMRETPSCLCIISTICPFLDPILGFTLLTSARTNQDAFSTPLSYCSAVCQYVEYEDISTVTWALTSKE